MFDMFKMSEFDLYKNEQLLPHLRMKDLQMDMKLIQCINCGKKGHIARKCRVSHKKDDTTNEEKAERKVTILMSALLLLPKMSNSFYWRPQRGCMDEEQHKGSKTATGCSVTYE